MLDQASKNIKHYLMIKTQLALGLRVSELINLSIKQINFNSREIRIETRTSTPYVSSFKTKTVSSNRTIPIPKNLAKELQMYLANRKTGYVFTSQKGGKYSKQSVIAFINKFANESPSIGRNIGSHSLRRTYASHLIENGVSIGDLSQLLGHSSIRTTMLYLRSISIVDHKAVEKALKKLIPMQEKK